MKIVVVLFVLPVVGLDVGTEVNQKRNILKYKKQFSNLNNSMIRTVGT